MDDFPVELQRGSLFRHVDPAHPNNWAFRATLSAEGVHQDVPRGKVVGGSSALNACVFERGLPEDFDEWAARGNDQWAFDKVLPFFKKLETDHDIKSEWHGSSGPVPVRRAATRELLPVDRAFLRACVDLGYPEDLDVNAPTSYGAGVLAVNSIDGFRMNTAVTYLTDEVLESRVNLTVRGNCFVRRVLFSGNRATGIEAEIDGQPEVLHANEIILSAGAVKSPHILMLSGVGPAGQLRTLGVPVVHDSPGVGQNFTDHCSMGVHYRIRRNSKIDLMTQHPWHVGLHYTADQSPYSGDMMLLPTSIPVNALVLYKMSLAGRVKFARQMMRNMSAGQLFNQVLHGNQLRIGIHLMKAKSKGEMTLNSADPHTPPSMQYHYFEDAFDLQRVRHGFRLAAELLNTGPYRDLGAVRTQPSGEDYATDLALDAFIRKHVQTSIHMSGTCQMGPDSDKFAVTNQFCQVRGVTGLRVVDMSIWPEVVRRCPNASAIMTGERAAAFFD